MGKIVILSDSNKENTDINKPIIEPSVLSIYNLVGQAFAYFRSVSTLLVLL